MKLGRSVLLVTSVVLSALLLGGGVAVKVRAQETSYRDSVIFAEILSLVLENYVDPVEGTDLLRGAYEGLLQGLDPNGAYLAPDEVAEWKAGGSGDAVGPGLSVLKLGHGLQVVAVEPGSASDEAGLEVGDHIRSIGGRSVGDLSLGQCQRLLRGRRGTTVAVEALKRDDEFEPVTVELTRERSQGSAFRLTVRGAVGVLRVTDLGRVDVDVLAEELDAVRSRGVEKVLVDLRNLADSPARDAARVAALFGNTASGPKLVLKDRRGRVVESVDGGSRTASWTGGVAVLVNGATAGGGEALARLLKDAASAEVFGEATFGLGAEAELIELDDGAGLLISVARWETPSGDTWNEDGVEPDREVRGRGDTYAEAAADQLDRVLELLDTKKDAEPAAA